MRKLIALMLAFALLLSPAGRVSHAHAEIAHSFTGLSDPALLRSVEDNVYVELIDQFDGEDHIIEDISAVYVSEEYIAELEYNSKANLFFGYTLAELDAQFQGQRYVFSLGDNGQTIVKEFVAYDNTYEQVIRNITVGTGVILVCVTVSVVTGGAGLTK